MTQIRQDAEMPPRDYSGELWMEPPAKPSNTSALVVADAAFAIASLGMAATFANLGLKVQAGG